MDRRPVFADAGAVDSRDFRHRNLRGGQTRKVGAVVLAKDSDFLDIQDRLGPPPQIIWITCGNTSNARLKEILSQALPQAMELLGRGEPLVEISDIRHQ